MRGKGGSYLSPRAVLLCSLLEYNSTAGVWTHLRQHCNPELKFQRHWDSPTPGTSVLPFMWIWSDHGHYSFLVFISTFESLESLAFFLVEYFSWDVVTIIHWFILTSFLIQRILQSMELLIFFVTWHFDIMYKNFCNILKMAILCPEQHLVHMSNLTEFTVV